MMMNGGGTAAMWIGAILGLVTVWALIALICRAVLAPRDPASRSDTQATLDQGGAGGEISTEEGRRVRTTLGHYRRHPSRKRPA
ncbi:hypothetical protein G5V59_19465 [Nocardioides sp. W3-2-3]|uniref:hypothetical protein n=1 Tax=Nocardioides convexus TaxID=2712224 RepID=UPI002418619C|nr:hypothetical protein [Nocardioides convexus]NHA01295.1 hypothetical protein [Nocardioides convexus]